MAFFEFDLMLGGEVISKLEMSWHELCEHGDEPFGELSALICACLTTWSYRSVLFAHS